MLNIGDLPLELQPKLLRAIQEQEFERLGSSYTTRIDVRIVAATNQNLAQMVFERRCRIDLYYRLNVAQRQGKSIENVPDDVVMAIERHDWPGNIRELQKCHRALSDPHQGRRTASADC